MASDREQRLAAMLDKHEIRECMERFSRGMDRSDRDIYLSAFWPDAETAAGPFVGSASDCWEWAVPMHEEGQILTHHALLQTNIEIDGDTAHAETYYLFVARNRDESVVTAGGRYIDRVERRDDEWRIALRTNIIEWAGLPPAIPPPFADVPDIAVNGVTARSHEDPSYARPLTNRRAPNNPAQG